MPVRRGKDSKGPFYRWGQRGKKYHYRSGDKRSRSTAKTRAKKQGSAIHSRKGQ